MTWIEKKHRYTLTIFLHKKYTIKNIITKNPEDDTFHSFISIRTKRKTLYDYFFIGDYKSLYNAKKYTLQFINEHALVFNGLSLEYHETFVTEKYGL